MVVNMEKVCVQLVFSFLGNVGYIEIFGFELFLQMVWVVLLDNKGKKRLKEVGLCEYKYYVIVVQIILQRFVFYEGLEEYSF